MTHFVDDETDIPGPKTNWDGTPASTADTAPDQYVRSADYNILRQAALDLREWVAAGLAPGTYALATVVVDARGRVTALAAGSAGLTDGDKGDIVVSSGGTVFTVDAGAVSNSKLAEMAATTFKANSTGGSAAPSDVSVATARTMLGLATIATTGSGADLTGATVTNAKLATMAANTLKGNNTGSTGAPIDLTTSQVLAMLQQSVGGFGDGSDGDAVFDGATAVTGYTRAGSVYTAQRECAFRNATFSAGVELDQTQAGVHTGFRLFFSGTVTPPASGTATIKYNGNPGATSTGGAALGTNPQGCTSAAGPSGIQNAGQAGNQASNWSNSVKGGAGGGGGSSPTAAGSSGGGVANTYAASLGDILTWTQALFSKIGMSNPGIVSGGGSGGSGAGTVGIAAGGGGGGGAGVGVVGIRTLGSGGTLVIEARGGAGGAGVGAIGSNAAGGGGGGGGILFVGYGGAAQPGNLTTQSPGGTGGVAQGTGNAGAAGNAGTVKFYPLGAA